jgi:hypothetical protein
MSVKKYSGVWNSIPFNEAAHDFKDKVVATDINSKPRFKQGFARYIETTSEQAKNTEILDDQATVEWIFGVGKPYIHSPEIRKQGETVEDIGNGKKLWTRINDKGDIQYWKISTAPLQYTGVKLFKKLGLYRKSIVIMDTDVGMKKFKEGPLPEEDIRLYVCFNVLTVADPAPKKNPYTASGKFCFSSESGIPMTALISNKTVLVRNNNELKMNFVIRNRLQGDPGPKRKTAQTWYDGDLYDKDAPPPSLYKTYDAHTDNAISKIRHYSLRELQNKYNRDQPPTKEEILGLTRKRSGDAFTMWIAKNLSKLVAVSELSYVNNEAIPPVVNAIDEYITRIPSEINGQVYISNNIFITTNDYQFLCINIECFGESILFKGQDLLIHFQRIRKN